MVVYAGTQHKYSCGDGLGGTLYVTVMGLNYSTFPETMVYLRHRRAELLGVERSVSPDLRLTTVVEMRGLRRSVTGHRRVLSALSQKLADRISLLAPDEPLVVGNLFRFSTLEQTLQLIYSGHIHLSQDDSEDVIDLLGAWRAQAILCSHFGGPGRSS